MTEILDFINSVLKKAEIPYEFGEWQSAVTYPYFVGSFSEDEYRFEDGYTGGTFILDGWSRSSMLDLLSVKDVIKEVFQCQEAVVGDRLFFICYSGAGEIPTNEAGLYKITIKLDLKEWKGE